MHQHQHYEEKENQITFKLNIDMIDTNTFHLHLTCLMLNSFSTRGVLIGKVGTGCEAQIGCFFGLSGLPMAPFLFENWFRYRSRFCKMHNFSMNLPLVYI